MADQDAPATRKTVHLICNAHLDPVWLWTWEEGMAEAVATFRIAADFCDAHPEFVFNHNESILYRWVEKLDPSLFARIRKLVARGQWHIAGGAYLQSDLNNASGESHIRNYLHGLAYFRDRFGVRPRVAYNFDPFGQPEGLTQILTGCGMSGYIFCRPDPRQWPLPVGAFVWHDRSGAAIMARRSDDHYLTNYKIAEKCDTFLPHFAGEKEPLLLWGLGNHGGGASRREYAALQAYAAEHPALAFVHSTPERFFDTLPAAADLPAVVGELQNCFLGCYTSTRRIKVAHRRLESRMAVAERLAALAWWLGMEAYPRAELDSAWRDILFCEFHDILPGSGAPEVETDTLHLAGHAHEALDRLTRHTLARLFRDEPRAAEGHVPIFFFNPHGFPVKRQVEFEYITAYAWPPSGRAVISLTTDGKRVPCQRVRASASCGGEWRVRLVAELSFAPFQAIRLDAALRVRKMATPTPRPEAPKTRLLELRSRSQTVVLNTRTGLVDGIVANRGGKAFVRRGAFRPVLFKDVDHSWDCGDPSLPPGPHAQYWNKPSDAFRLATRAETAALISDPELRADPTRPAALPPVRIIEDGRYRTVVEAIFVNGRSTIVRHYVVGKRDDLFQVRDRVHYAHRDHMLKLDIPLAFEARRGVAETPYSAAVRAPTRAYRDRSNQRWVAACGDDAFVAVINDGSFAHTLQPRRLCVNLLRSPAYASFGLKGHGNRQVARAIPRQDQGEHEFVFELVCGRRFSEGDVSRRAALLNMPPVAQVYFPGGTADAAGRLWTSPLACESAQVIIEAVKQADVGTGLIVRLREAEGRAVATALHVGADAIPVRLDAYQLKTLRLARRGGSVRARETTLVEGL